MHKQATPYLIFQGNAKEALQYYQEIFEGEVLHMLTFGEADFPTPPDIDEHVMHAQFKKGEMFLMVSDTFPDHPIVVGNNISLTLEMKSEEETQQIYDALRQKGQVLMELQDTFWGAKYAKVKDPFDVIWDLNCPKS